MAGSTFEIVASDDFGAGYKACKTCGEEKPLLEFHKDKAGALGRKANCKACVNKGSESKRRQPIDDMVYRALESAAYRILKERGL